MSDYRRGAPDPPAPRPDTSIRIVRDDGTSIPVEDFEGVRKFADESAWERAEGWYLIRPAFFVGFAIGAILAAVVSFIVSRF